MLNDKKTVIDRKMDSPFARMGMAWFTVWPSRLPILAPKTATTVRIGLTVCLLLVGAYCLVPRASCAFDASCKIANIVAFNSQQNFTQNSVAQQLVLPAGFTGQSGEWRIYQSAGIYSSNIFVRVAASGQPELILRSAELLNHRPFEFDIGTLHRNWDGGWIVNLKNAKGELLLSPLGTPRMIRYSMAERANR